MASSFAKKIEQMNSGDHACLIYDSPEQQLAAVLPFIKGGLERGEACFYIANDRSLDDVKQSFAGCGISVDSEVKRGALIFSQSNTKSEAFSPDEMVSVLRQLVGDSIKKGFRGLRGSGEMTWVLGADCGCDRLIEYEGLLNEKFPTHLTGICQYNRSRFKPEMIRDILRTHPVIITGNAVCRNLYCESHQAMNGDIPQDSGVGWMLDNLRNFYDLEEKLRHLIQVRDDFVAVAGHELRTPLTALKLANDANLRKLEKGHDLGPAELLSFMKNFSKQFDRLGQIFDRIIDVSLLSKGQFDLSLKTMDLVEAVQTTVQEFRASYPYIDIAFEHPKSLLGTWDPIRIQQITANLLSNAIKFGEEKPIQVVIAKDKDSACLVVKDQGLGIAKADQKRIFELYERAVSFVSISGLGLGLFVVDQIAKAHGGRVSLESEVGRGSAFKVSLPLLTNF